ncbi:MAG: hypothetical protein L0Z62_37220 [Gemmataceae bacterium]|nr:hypothetical protein [Gemmataceae bacterium]
MGPFLGMAVQRPLAGLAVDTQVRNLAQPPGSRLVEMLQGAEGPTVEQVGLDVLGRSTFPLVCGRRGWHATGRKP